MVVNQGVEYSVAGDITEFHQFISFTLKLGGARSVVPVQAHLVVEHELDEVLQCFMQVLQCKHRHTPSENNSK